MICDRISNECFEDAVDSTALNRKARQNKGKDECYKVFRIELMLTVSATCLFNVPLATISLIQQRFQLAIYNLLPMLDGELKHIGMTK